MKTEILITQAHIVRAGEIKFFQISLPRGTRRIIAISSEIFGVTASKGQGKDGAEQGTGQVGGNQPSGESQSINTWEKSVEDVMWDVDNNLLGGRLIIQDMKQANLFYYEQIWATVYYDGISNLDGISSMAAFTDNMKIEPKAVDVPCKNTILNCLYRDIMGTTQDSDMGYTVKVYLWIECEKDLKEKKRS